MKFAIVNLGCKVNQYESDSMLTYLKAQGYEAEEGFCRADVYIVNTCAVTAVSQKKSVQAIARIRAVNENAKIVITGCASQNAPEKFTGKENVVFVGGSFAKNSIAQTAINLAENKIIQKDFSDKTFHATSLYEQMQFPVSPRTRSYIKIEDGCNQFCSYCLIPYLRGRVRSRLIEDVVDECTRAAGLEIVLTGINLSAYGSDIGLSLTDLIKKLATLKKRIRLGSLEVNVIDEAFLDALDSLEDFCPHFHLSLQSGSDEVLKSMNRRYSVQTFAEKTDLIRSRFPNAAITTDVIVGFPTETEEEFQKGAAFIDSVRFSDLHVFPYSPRKGTVAERRYAPLEKSTVKMREKILLQAKEKARQEYQSRFIQKEISVLGERCNNGVCEGYSKNYLRIYSETISPGEIKNLIAVRPYLDGLWAEEKKL